MGRGHCEGHGGAGPLSYSRTHCFPLTAIASMGGLAAQGSHRTSWVSTEPLEASHNPEVLCSPQST